MAAGLNAVGCSKGSCERSRTNRWALPVLALGDDLIDHLEGLL